MRRYKSTPQNAPIQEYSFFFGRAAGKPSSRPGADSGHLDFTPARSQSEAARNLHAVANSTLIADKAPPRVRSKALSPNMCKTSSVAIPKPWQPQRRRAAPLWPLQGMAPVMGSTACLKGGGSRIGVLLCSIY